MNRPPLSVTIISLNEERNIGATIESVKWADEVIVVDSGSTDRTIQIAKSLGAKVILHPWPGYGQQKNFAQRQAAYDWILNIDADEIVTEKLAKEIQEALELIGSGKSQAVGFSLPRKTFYLGRWIQHGGWYPNSLFRLSHRDFGRWSEPHVHEQLIVSGPTLELKEPLEHYAFGSIEEQVLTNLRFSHLGSLDLAQLGTKASVARLIFKPLGKFLETYLLKKGFLDGLPGFIISVNAAHSMFLKYAYLCEELIRMSHQGEKNK